MKGSLARKQKGQLAITSWPSSVAAFSDAALNLGMAGFEPTTP